MKWFTRQKDGNSPPKQEHLPVIEIDLIQREIEQALESYKEWLMGEKAKFLLKKQNDPVGATRWLEGRSGVYKADERYFDYLAGLRDITRMQFVAETEVQPEWERAQSRHVSCPFNASVAGPLYELSHDVSDMISNTLAFYSRNLYQLYIMIKIQPDEIKGENLIQVSIFSDKLNKEDSAEC